MLPRPLAPLLLTLLAFLLVAVPHASAEPIQWSYTGEIVTTGPNSTPISGVNYGPKVLIAAIPNTNGSIGIYIPGLQAQFADGSGPATDSANVTAFRMRTTTSAGPYEGPFHKEIHTFNLTVGLKDAASGASGFLSFKGSLDGAIRGGTFPWGPPTAPTPIPTDLHVAFASPTSQTLVLGEHKYEVSVDPFLFGYRPEVAKDGFSPYQSVPMSVRVSEVPEPASLALAAMGLAGLGLRAWRKRRKGTEEAAA